MVKKGMYHEIKRLQKQGYGKNRISRELGVDKRTVIKYRAMDEEEYRCYLVRSLNRKKDFDSFRTMILDLYRDNDCIRLPVSAVYDYLEEAGGELPANENSLRNYIRYLQKTGQLTLSEKKRYYTRVADMPYGLQLQIDFGEQMNQKGGKYYIFAAVLSASRFKHAALQERPFTTYDLVEHLLDCFDYLGGIPGELVIDQDSIMVVAENAGDIIYTKVFGDFIGEMGLRMRVCRKADPESKGKIENFIKYIKHNFFAFREFEDIQKARENLMKWLERRANGKISQATKKIPLIEIEEERKHLRALKNSIYRKNYASAREARIVNSNCRIAVDTCQYDLPGRYRNQVVEIYRTENKLFVFDRYSNEEIARYPLSMVPGVIVKNRAVVREMGVKVQELKNEVMGYFTCDNWTLFLSGNFSTFPRYIRDQCLEARKCFRDHTPDPETFDLSLRYCIDNKIFSMGNLKNSYRYFLEERKHSEQSPVQILATRTGETARAAGLMVSKPDLAPYLALVNAPGGVQ